MRLFTKVSLCTLLILTVALAAAGYFLISASFDESLNRETDRALEEYQLLKFNLQSLLLNAKETDSLSDESLLAMSWQTLELAPEDTVVTVYNGKTKTTIASNMTSPLSLDTIDDLSKDELQYSLHKTTEDDSYYMTVFGTFSQSDQLITLYIARNIDVVFTQRDNLIKSYQVIYGIVIIASVIVMIIVLAVLTHPIKNLTAATVHIANGNYNERAVITTSDEIGTLANEFNHMAETIEEKIRELELNAQQKEDFVANFAHELKTPLTSVIGYADMLYQKNLPQQKVKDAASYILNEGMRLEALSFKLMELIVLGKENFTLEALRADELFHDIFQSIIPMMEKYNVELTPDVKPAYILVEYDLIKTLMLNLIDNAVKADSKKIIVSGKIVDDAYRVMILDDGRGIPPDELARITEAFYMIDKSRSRSQHGAGLGLSISSRIAEIHGTKLDYKSKPGLGTIVSFSLSIAEEEHE